MLPRVLSFKEQLLEVKEKKKQKNICNIYINIEKRFKNCKILKNLPSNVDPLPSDFHSIIEEHGVSIT